MQVFCLQNHQSVSQGQPPTLKGHLDYYSFEKRYILSGFPLSLQSRAYLGNPAQQKFRFSPPTTTSRPVTVNKLNLRAQAPQQCNSPAPSPNPGSSPQLGLREDNLLANRAKMTSLQPMSSLGTRRHRVHEEHCRVKVAAKSILQAGDGCEIRTLRY